MTRSVLLAGSVFLGMLVPPLASLLSPLVLPAIFCLMLLSALQIDLRAAPADLAAAPGPLLAIVLWQMLVTPALVGLTLAQLSDPARWADWLFLTACAASIFGAPAFARIAGLDDRLTLNGVVAGNLLMPLSLPLLAPWFLLQAPLIDGAAYLLRLLIFLLVPIALAAGYQWRFGVPDRCGADRLGRLSLLALVVFAVGIMDGVGERLVRDPGGTGQLLALAVALHLALFAATAALFSPWGRRLALTAALLAAYRNLGMLLAVAGDFVAGDFVVFVALWQIPMYVMPMLVVPLLARRAPDAPGDRR